MNRLESRVRKIEARAGAKDRDNPFIIYYYHESDSEEDEATARSEAVAKWEAQNGPLGDREPSFIAVCFVSPKEPLPAPAQSGEA